MRSYLSRDIEQFQQGYPHQGNNTRLRSNLDFYTNAAPMMPDGLKYEDFLQKYGKDWRELEANHGFIQWLFPIPEQGVNHRAHPLQKHELEAMKADPEVLDRILKSYKTMLAFYGIDFNSGHLRLSPNHAGRLENLSYNAHNLLRITRILKCISLFPALQPHAAPLVTFFAALHEDGYIDFSSRRMHGSSLDEYWSQCFRDEAEREMVRAYVAARGRFVRRKVKTDTAAIQKPSASYPAPSIGEIQMGDSDGEVEMQGPDDDFEPGSRRKKAKKGKSGSKGKNDAIDFSHQDECMAAETVDGSNAPLRGLARWEKWYRIHRMHSQPDSGAPDATTPAPASVSAKDGDIVDATDAKPDSQRTMVEDETMPVKEDVA